ncbi:MAG TPA: TonB-dependent receptor [Cytophagales bacterium]|nr:TonB-dependent receptor [Cytophagales bacterium]
MKKILPLVLFSMLIFTGFSVKGNILFQDDNQNAVVNGQVKDDVSGEGLPGVTVMIEGTTIGTTTDFDGKYSLQVPNPESAVLVFSYLGYHTEKVSVNNQTTINFSLVPKIEELDELVVVGYGVQKRSNVTGAISSVKVENMENKPITRLDQALQGMSSGVTVTQNGGSPGAEPTIHIRGIGSIGNTKPLWIVDGVRMEPGNHFDPDDIESIEILKDAASSAIYGAKAAHGVILVTTKRGKGKTSFNFNSSIGQRQPINLPKLLNSADYVAYKKQSRINAGQDPDPSWDNYEHDTDWLDAYYAGKGTIQSNNLSLSKGEEKYNIFLSLGYDNEKGILIDNTYKRLSGRVNSDVKITKWLKFGESVLLSKVIENPIGNFNASSDGAIPYRSIPLAPIYDENNPYGGWGEAPGYFGGPNPVASQYQQHETRTYNRLDGNMYVEITPLKGLMLKGTVGYNHMSYIGEKFDEAFDYGIFTNTINSLTYSAAKDETILGNIVASYEKNFSNHYFKIMGGYEASKFETLHFNVVGTKFPVDKARSFGLATGEFSVPDRANYLPYTMISYFGRFNYNFKEKYLFEANIRRDGSSKFGPENKFGIFPSFSAGWNVSKEGFFRNIPYLSTMKLRASTGRLGSDNIGDYIFQKTYLSRFTSYAYAPDGEKNLGFYISKFPNREVKWEEVNMHNIGIDLTAFRNRLSFSVDYYIKDTKDLLYQVPVPSSIGLSVHNQNTVNPDVNIGTLRNTGLDFEVGYQGQVKRFTINVNGNTSFIKNELKSLKNQVITGGGAGTIMGGMTRTEAGHPISSFYGYIVQGMFNSDRDVYAYNSYATDGFYQEAQTGPGDLIYKDISGPEGVPDGQITAEHDRTFIGNPWPKMTYALNVAVEWNKLIDISLQFQGVQGVDVFNGDKAYRRNFFGDNNTTTDIYEAWTPENPTNHPRNIAIDPNGNFSKPSTYFVEDGSYLKLRNAQIGVNVPQSILSQLKIQKLRIYVNANNFLTFTKYSGNDPEIAGNNTSRGVDYGVYPMVRTISCGLQLQF